MEIAFNDSLENLEGLNNLAQVNGLLNIRSNTRLERLDGLDNLALVTGPFNIESNNNLERLDGLESLTRVGDNFSIAANMEVRNLHGLSGLEQVGGSVSITQNTVLQSLDGLNNLSVIGGYLQIRWNTWLDNLDALVELDSIGSSANLSVVIRDNERLEWCCGLFKALTERPLQGQIIMRDNRASCTQEVVVENGPCCPPGSELPLDKVFFAESAWGIAPVGTNVFIQDYQPNIQYILREVDGNIPVAGPQAGDVGPMFISGITEDTEYNMLARNPVTGCTAEMTTRILIHAFVYPSTCANPPLDKTVVAEQDSGTPGMATNIIVLNGEEGVVYALRENGSDAWVTGPYPASAGLYTGAVDETTTFNVLAIDEDTHCSIQMTDEVTITIDAFGQMARMAADDTGSEKTQLRGLSVYPNPSNGEFDVEIPDKGSYQLQVRDMTGRSVATREVLKSEGVAKIRMGLTDKPAGMYILTIYNNHGVVATRKVVIRQ